MIPGFSDAVAEAIQLIASYQVHPKHQGKIDDFLNRVQGDSATEEETAEGMKLSARAMADYFSWAPDEARVILDLGMGRYDATVRAIKAAPEGDGGTTLCSFIASILVFGIVLGERMERCLKR